MASVALIGADGAGKTTIAKHLSDSFPRPVKYLYMGMNPHSSQYALPTSRLFFFIKLHLFKRSAKSATRSGPRDEAAHDLAHKHYERGRLLAMARLLNHLAEEWYRQIISWSYQLRGYTVIYDRHFAFDYAARSGEAGKHDQRLTERLHRWLLNNAYPQPSLVMFLDAPPEVLFERKGEATLPYLEMKRKTFLEQGKRTANFVRIDATQPLERVLTEVTGHMMALHPPGKLEKTAS